MNNSDENLNLRGDSLVESLAALTDKDKRDDGLMDYAIEQAVIRSARLKRKEKIKQVIQAQQSKGRIKKLSLWVSAIAASMITIIFATMIVFNDNKVQSYSLEIDRDLENMNQLFIEQTESLGFANSLSPNYKRIVQSLLSKNPDLNSIIPVSKSLEGDEKKTIDEYLFLMKINNDIDQFNESTLENLPNGDLKIKYSKILEDKKE